MKELEKDERLLCELQGKIFEKSVEEYGTSSAVFVRRYMNSDYAARMDRIGFIGWDIYTGTGSVLMTFPARQYIKQAMSGRCIRFIMLIILWILCRLFRD